MIDEIATLSLIKPATVFVEVLKPDKPWLFNIGQDSKEFNSFGKAQNSKDESIFYRSVTIAQNLESFSHAHEVTASPIAVQVL